MNTAMVSLNTIVRQMTEMLQWPKCLSKKTPITSTFIYWKFPLQNLVYIVYICVFLLYAININNALMSVFLCP